MKFNIYADADYAEEVVDRKSYTDYLGKFGGSCIDWESKKQSVVALSSTEAEYYCLCEAPKEAEFLRNFIVEDIGLLNASGLVVLWNDSQSAQSIIKGTNRHKRTKHIDVRWYFVKNLVSEGKVVIE